MANDDGSNFPRAGKTILVDPNSFDGQNSSNNMSVPLEDLSISVQLTTERKARTILLQNKDKATASSSPEVRVSFLEGTEVNGKKVLTTSFTDLTTSFDYGNDPEGLGITGIDIDFNSSYAPLITINFIDVRGTAIFQNEGNVATGKNKYSTFFQLPYPLYQLTIKGYYGMPVSYCLHMTKFTSRFNSQTGNFEITASFIGYTYAMLSDMLLGFLKAIPYTKKGGKKYADLVATEPNLLNIDGKVLTLNGLIDAINAINVNSQKIGSDDPEVANIKKADSKHTNLDAIKTNLNMLGNNLDSKDFDEYNYIVLDDTLTSKKIEDFTKDYQNAVVENIKIYNSDDNKFGIKDSDFTTLKIYKDLSMDLLKTYTTSDEKYQKLSQILNFSEADTKELSFENKVKQIYNHVSKNDYFGDKTTKLFTMYDLSEQNKILAVKHNEIKKYVESLQTSVADKLRAAAREALGFDPTVRNIINVFTVAAEVFLSVIYEVSEEAKKSDVRVIQLEKFKGSVDTSYDYKMNTNTTETTKNNYYPWPDYREVDDKNGLVEKYLGEPFVLDVPSDVDELFFIDDLLKAFLLSKQAEDKSAQALEATQENWVGANPIDTRLFGNTKFPYERIEALDYKDIIRLMMIRFMTYAFSNKNLSVEEVQTIATIELDSALKWCVNDKAVEAFAQSTSQYFKDAEGKINDDVKKVIGGPESSSYFYTYIGGTNEVNATSVNDKHFIPINDRFTGVWRLGSYQDPSIPSGIESRKAGSLFLSNYGQTKYTSSTGVIKKEDDGAYYIKIFTPEQYTPSGGVAPTPVGAAPTELSLEGLKKDWKKFDYNTAGFNLVGGSYGVQEFFILDWGEESLKGLPFRYLFYGDGIIDDTPTNKTNGLALKRKSSTNSMLKKLTDVQKKDESGFIKALTQGGTATPFDTNFPGLGAPSIRFRIPNGDITDNALQQYMNTVDDNELEGIDFWATNNLRSHSRYGETRALANLLEQGSSEVCYPYINFNVQWDNSDDAQGLAPVSLFGSRFYYAQTSDYSRALLFLHTFPWNGLINDKDEDKLFSFTTNNTIFDKPEIYNTFGQRAGFVSTPMLWTAFIGAMLWRADYSAPIMNGDVQTGGGSGSNDPIIFVNGTEALIPSMEDDSIYPTKLQFLTKTYDLLTTEKGKGYRKTQMTFDPSITINHSNDFAQYKNLGPTLLGLPEQAKDEFKQAFFNFVNGDFKRVKTELEVVTSGPSLTANDTAWKLKYNAIKASITTPPTDWTTTFGNKVITVANMKAQYKSFDNYIIFAQLYKFTSINNYGYNYVMEVRDGSPAGELLLNLFKKELIIANTSFIPWMDGISAPNDSALNTEADKTKSIYVSEGNLTVFIDTVLLKLKEVKDGLSESAKKKQAEQEIFGTTDDNVIKLQLYRTCKNIYDKWIGGSNSPDIIFQCGGRNRLDYELVKKRTNGTSSTPKLIDSFRFVTRSFRDIGDEMVINPIPVVDVLRDNPNTSFYDAVTNLLSSNNFDFIPLPSYINYGDPETLSSIFKPMPSYEAFGQGTVGPSFVCVYVGQKSKHLDYEESEYTGDGFDVRCSSDGKFDKSLPLDFTTESSSHENQVAVFSVNYGQQNQNIFKDITLDQSEFSETAESLQIIDDISKKGSENNKTLAGQNLYNVYAVRSYKTEVEMMGNAMIQPMMYFQLNNIPMFHGAYMITHVKHSIKPNFMSTNFTGVRIRQVETPLIGVKDLFMSLIDSLSNSNVTDNSGSFGTTPTNGTAVNRTGSRSDYFGFVTYDVPESDSLKFQEKNGSIKANGDSWAMPECGEFMVELAKKWHNANKSLPSSDILLVNNFGAYQGGTVKKHGGDGGLHACGLAVDLRPMSNNKLGKTCIVGASNYDQAKNIEFIQMAIDMSNSQDKIKVQNIILNDSVIIEHFKTIKNAQGGKTVIFVEGHHNHIHIEFDYPPRVVAELNNNVNKNTAIVSSGTKGSVVKNTGNYPTKEQKIAALGQI